MTARFLLRPVALALSAALLTACHAGAPSATAPLQAQAASPRCAVPALPDYASLQANRALPNLFTFLGGAPVNSVQDWDCRKAELRALVQRFALGQQPQWPDQSGNETVAGQFSVDTVQVSVTRQGKTISFPVKITYPSTGQAPYPAMIGVGMVSLDHDELLSQGIAIISFPNNELAQQQNAASRGKGKFYELYGADHTATASMAWSWGISRLIDALETTVDARIDPARLGVTGCSRNGKGALVAGAFDERIALTIAQESGNGGASGWRVADAQRAAGQNVQTLRQIVQENVWFTDSFKQFAETANRLPFDQHSLMSLIAPRGLLVLENTSMEWLGNQSAYTTSMAARETWKALGRPDGFGFSQVGGHQHCQLPRSQFAHVNRFAKKFLLGDRTLDTSVHETDGTFSKDLSVWIDWPTPTLQ